MSNDDKTPLSSEADQTCDTAAETLDSTAVESAESTATESAESPAANGEERQTHEGGLQASVIAVLKTVYDPEIPVDIYELGLIYDVAISDEGKVDIKMTLTSPACPVAGTLPGEVQQRVAAVEGVTGSNVELVWDPPWDKDKMSEAAMLELGME